MKRTKGNYQRRAIIDGLLASTAGQSKADRGPRVPAERNTPAPAAAAKTSTPPTPIGDLPPVPPFPLDVVPAAVANYWSAAAKSMAVPVDYVAVPGLALLGAAIGRSRATEVKPGYHESPLLWVAVVAPPGSAKSSSLKAARDPLTAAELRWLDTFRSAADVYAIESDRHQQMHKGWKADGCEGDPPERPAKPVLRQVVLDDATVEAAARVLSENPRGLCVIKDELIAFVNGLNQYKTAGGADRQFWLSAWAGATAKVNRISNHDAGPLVIPDPFAAVAGMLCPDSLEQLRGDTTSSDGWADRFLFSFPDPLPVTGELWQTVSAEEREGYAAVFDELLAIDPDTTQAGRPRPVPIPLGPSGRVAWGEFTEQMAIRMNKLGKFDSARGVLSKLKGYCARLACIVHCLRRVTNDIDPGAAIDSETIVRAARLVDYFDSHGRRCKGGAANRDHQRAIAVLGLLAGWKVDGSPVPGFAKRELHRKVQNRSGFERSDSLDAPLKLLTEHGYVTPVAEFGSGPGRRSDRFEVNPAWERQG